MRRAPVAAATVALALSGSLSGCTSDDPRTPTSTVSSPPPTGASTDPTTPDPTSTPTGGADPPALPEAAQARTTAGAKAFVTYYADVLNYAWHELDSSMLSAASSTDCDVCKTIVRKIGVAARRGGFQKGGAWTVTEQHSIPNSHRDQASVLVSLSIANGSWKQTAGDVRHNIVATRVTDEFVLVWTAGGWKVLALKST